MLYYYYYYYCDDSVTEISVVNVGGLVKSVCCG